MNLSLPNYNAWTISKSDFPAEGSIDDQIAFLLGYGVLAPSQHNTQPWAFSISGSKLRILVDDTRSLPVGDPENSGAFISLGACAENIVQAGMQFGLSAVVRFINNQAELEFEHNPNAETSAEVLRSIVTRHSDKSLYDGEPLDENDLGVLRGISAEGLECVVISDESRLDRIEDIHNRATGMIARDPDFVKELSGWLRSNYTRKFDGMPGFVSGLSGLQALVGKYALLVMPKLFQKMIKHDEALMASASAISIWAVKDRTPEALFVCGRHIERLWLKAVQIGLAVHPMHSMCADPESRSELATICGLKASPVFVVRMGRHPDSGFRTPRRKPVWN